MSALSKTDRQLVKQLSFANELQRVEAIEKPVLEHGEYAIKHFADLIESESGHFEQYRLEKLFPDILFAKEHVDLEHVFVLDIPAKSTGTVVITNSAFTQLLIHIGKESEMTIVEKIANSDIFQTTNSTICVVGEQAKVQYIFTRADRAKSVSFHGAHVEKGGQIDWHMHLLNADQTFEQVQTTLAGIDAKCTLSGSYFGTDKEQYLMKYGVEHLSANTTSNLQIHGCLMGDSLGIFQGNVHLYQAAHQAQTHVGEQCLLIGRKARHETIPALSVDTNDVSATHSSSTSQIDEEQLFYAQSRGLTYQYALELMVTGFLESITKKVPDAFDHEQLHHMIIEKLKAKI